MNGGFGRKGSPLFFAKDALKACGAKIKTNLSGKAVHDRELITGQDPFDDEKLAAVFIAQLSIQTMTKSAPRKKSDAPAVKRWRDQLVVTTVTLTRAIISPEELR